MIFNREPVLFQGLVFAVINLLVVLGVLHLTDLQLGAVNAAFAALLGLVVRQKVSPTTG